MELMLDRPISEERLAVGTRVTPPDSSAQSSRKSTVMLPKRFSKLSELMLCRDVEINVNAETVDIGRSKFMFFLPGSNSTSRRESRVLQRNGSQSSLATGSLVRLTGTNNKQLSMDNRVSVQARLSALRLHRNSKEPQRITTAESKQQQSREAPKTYQSNRNRYLPALGGEDEQVTKSIEKSTFRNKQAASVNRKGADNAKGPFTKQPNQRRSEQVQTLIHKFKHPRNGSDQTKSKPEGKENQPKVVVRRIKKPQKQQKGLAGKRVVTDAYPRQDLVDEVPELEHSFEMERISTIQGTMPDEEDSARQKQQPTELISQRPKLESPVETVKRVDEGEHERIVNQLAPEKLVVEGVEPRLEALKMSKVVEAKNTKAMISLYDDLFLSGDFREMSSLLQLNDEGQYYSQMTSYDELPLQLPVRQTSPHKQLRDAMMETEDHDPQPTHLVAPANKEDSNYELLKSQIQETQIALSKLMEQSASRIQPDKPKEHTRAGILQYAHIDEQLKDLYISLKPRSNTFFDSEFSINSQTTGKTSVVGLLIEEIPRASNATPVLFTKDLGEVRSNDLASSSLCTVLNLLALNSPEMITRLFEPAPPQLEGNPMFCVWLNVDGQFNPLFLDAYLPYNSETLEPLFCYSRTGGQVWPELIEKALAKALEGYEQIQLLCYEELLHILTGMHTHKLHLSSKPEQAWKSLIAAIDNGCFIFAEDDERLVYIENYASVDERSLYLKIDNKRKLIPFAELCEQYPRILIANLNPNYHFNYHQLELMTNRTVVVELNSRERSHVYLSLKHNGLTVTQSSKTNLSVCVYRAEEELLRLVAEKSSETLGGLWMELILKKGLYKIFVSSQPLRLAAVDPLSANITPQSEPVKTDRSMHCLSTILTVTSRDNLRCQNSVDTLKKQGDSKLGNQSISYQAVKASSSLSQKPSIVGNSKPSTEHHSAKKRKLERSVRQPMKIPPARSQQTFLTSRNFQEH